MMEEDLRAALLGAPAVAGLVGTRVAWGELPQGAGLPGVVLQLVSQPREHVLDGVVGLVRSRVQVDCWAESYAGAKALGRAVAARLDGFDGAVGGTLFQGLFRDGARDGREPGAPGSAGYFRVSFDFLVNHQERD